MHAFASFDTIPVEGNLYGAVIGAAIGMSDYVGQRFVHSQYDRPNLRIPEPKHHGYFAHCGAYRAEQLGIAQQR